jgi:hypothetical protein
MRTLVVVVVLAHFACAQELHLPVFDRLKPQASNVVDLNLSKDLLGLGAGFLGGDKGDGAKVKKVVEGLNNIVIHSLEFEKAGAYSDADVDQIIHEMDTPGWKLVVSADEKKKGHEISRIWLKSTGEGELGGLRIMSAEPKELSIIEITGKIRLEDLKELGGLGVPNILSQHTAEPVKKNDE